MTTTTNRPAPDWPRRSRALLRWLATATFTAIAACPAIGVMFCWIVGFWSLGVGTYAVAAALVAIGSVGAYLCRREPPCGRHAQDAVARKEWDDQAWFAGIPADQDGPPSPELDEAMERLEESLRLPPYLPPHEYRVRPPYPRPDPGHG